MQSEVMFKNPVSSRGRNGTYTQTGIDICTSDSLRGCRNDAGPMQSGVILQPIGNRGILNCEMEIPERELGAVIKQLQAARKDLRDARRKAKQAPESAGAEAPASDLVGQHADEAAAV